MKAYPLFILRSLPLLTVITLAMNLLIAPHLLASPELWTGPNITFTKPNNTDWHLAANQDRITFDVWLTRDITQGLFNAATESSYTHFSSPQNTEWSYGTLAN